MIEVEEGVDVSVLEEEGDTGGGRGGRENFDPPNKT